jgi:TfoX/Sxy family transcriptional regulator of competence genes
MPYNEDLARRVRQHLSGRDGISERKMFGGLCFMVNGNMFCGVVKDELMVRVGPAGHEAALRRPYARPMDFTGRPMTGMVFVEPPGTTDEADLAGWVADCLAFSARRPAK